MFSNAHTRTHTRTRTDRHAQYASHTHTYPHAAAATGFRPQQPAAGMQATMGMTAGGGGLSAMQPMPFFGAPPTDQQFGSPFGTGNAAPYHAGGGGSCEPAMFPGAVTTAFGSPQDSFYSNPYANGSGNPPAYGGSCGQSSGRPFINYSTCAAAAAAAISRD
eukprot:GHVU01102062.1.p2 GENE.GHVU01102062.1~~GHVU01102062.1.p2  ORF type:complete len:162 (+),score=21.57 GHVU01102062.1:75-560(+)